LIDSILTIQSKNIKTKKEIRMARETSQSGNKKFVPARFHDLTPKTKRGASGGYTSFAVKRAESLLHCLKRDSGRGRIPQYREPRLDQ
jgi:hypothetical protein